MLYKTDRNKQQQQQHVVLCTKRELPICMPLMWQIAIEMMTVKKQLFPRQIRWMFTVYSNAVSSPSFRYNFYFNIQRNEHQKCLWCLFILFVFANTSHACQSNVFALNLKPEFKKTSIIGPIEIRNIALIELKTYFTSCTYNLKSRSGSTVCWVQWSKIKIYALHHQRFTVRKLKHTEKNN